MLDDTGVRNIAVRVIYDGISLVVVNIREDLGLEPQRAIFKRAAAVSEELVDHTGVDQSVKGILSECIRRSPDLRAIFLAAAVFIFREVAHISPEIDAETHRNSRKEF